VVSAVALGVAVTGGAPSPVGLTPPLPQPLHATRSATDSAIHNRLILADMRPLRLYTILPTKGGKPSA
jgi:hypothetical protein